MFAGNKGQGRAFKAYQRVSLSLDKIKLTKGLGVTLGPNKPLEPADLGGPEQWDQAVVTPRHLGVH